MSYEAPQYQPTQPPGKSRTQLFGIIGIIGAICCLPLGVVFSFLSYTEAKRYGSSRTLAYIGFVLVVLALISEIFYFANGGMRRWNR